MRSRRNIIKRALLFSSAVRCLFLKVFHIHFKKFFLSGASQLEAHKCYIKRSCRRSLRAQKALFRARHMFYKYQVSLPGFFFFSPIWNCSLRLSIQSEIQLYFQKLHWFTNHFIEKYYVDALLDRALQKLGASVFE